ncbi:hypothetical protein [Ornithinimicrobium pekingense]|uniref:Sugar ABC transporter ATPase n=1 Tax=Ornithinimicrobium pekingense TaxID=384677 RepID=A0ABQ2F972_9MICO|nr:hypothetical protein [Ornithinimicrobium pekingense]GGK73063.1 hypothetical protein GCM10011509_22070 [Ornithinimicrobium pekingense]
MSDDLSDTGSGPTDSAATDGRTDGDPTGPVYDPEQDPDSDPDMLQEQHPASVGENERDPAEGPDDASATDG